MNRRERVIWHPTALALPEGGGLVEPVRGVRAVECEVGVWHPAYELRGVEPRHWCFRFRSSGSWNDVHRGAASVRVWLVQVLRDGPGRRRAWTPAPEDAAADPDALVLRTRFAAMGHVRQRAGVDVPVTEALL